MSLMLPCMLYLTVDPFVPVQSFAQFHHRGIHLEMRKCVVLQLIRTFLVEPPKRKDSGEGSGRMRVYRGRGIYRSELYMLEK